MANYVTKSGCLVLLGAGAMALANPAHAQDQDQQIQEQALAELDRLSDLSVDEEGGVAAAQDQAASGQLLEALATLERVMAVHPRSANARMLHAFYLCAIDDQQGGLVEIDNMDEDDFGEQNLAELRTRCRTASSEFPAATAPVSEKD